MVRVGHLFDGGVGWEQRLRLGPLLERLPQEECKTSVASIDPRARIELRGLGLRIAMLGRSAGGPLGGILALFAQGAVGRWLARNRIELVHAWGVEAGLAACSGLRARRESKGALVVEMGDPTVESRSIRKLRIVQGAIPIGIACASQTVRRRLVEGGIPSEVCVTIRPGIDFGQLNHWRKSPLRRHLGIEPNELVVILAPPVNRRNGSFEAFFAGALRHAISGSVRVIVPGANGEVDRILRFARTLPTGNNALAPGPAYSFERLISISDVMLVPARGDVSTTCISYAMAAGVAVIGAAEYATAELIAHKVNGLLFKAKPDQNMALPLARLLHDKQSMEKCKEAGRGQAFEVFGLQRFVEQYKRLYSNLMSGLPLGDGIEDPAALS